MPVTDAGKIFNDPIRMAEYSVSETSETVDVDIFYSRIGGEFWCLKRNADVEISGKSPHKDFNFVCSCVHGYTARTLALDSVFMILRLMGIKWKRFEDYLKIAGRY